jgi:penicillin amidase
VIEDLLRQQPAGWTPNNDWGDWLIQQLAAALQDGRKLQGGDIAKWRWGRALQWNFQHPVGKQLPLVSSFFDIGPIAMSGSSTTVKQTTSTLGPSERMVVDLANLDNSVMNLRVGESGHVASSHYKDEWPAYYVGKSFRMQFDSVEAKHVLHIVPSK